MKRRKKYIKFTDKSHAVNGVVSTILGSISIIFMLALVMFSYMYKGEAGIYIGSIGLMAFIIALVGLGKGIKSFQERERYYLFSKIGSILNAIIITLWIAIYVIGTWYL
ncbi:DUF6142 family protein [Candidatus Galacturonibacter soehngenii]|uniref:Uncharacterized protein n=1 Tax=Candidatus Galacturonatibacter soehngenii TaxID=2307010 RepID=A0A7V7UDR7_9FIRM|nr:DUF6142 family protein [Candidatus Galacturonibacter soehngenii]KAB1441012.1 hypothetical protein F7O84_00580 [Candidatus Galacturonibacter soehngenii]MBA4688417.1 hypothetical protein [Candidatus Galacturonibacter soehngenii]